MNYEVSQEFKGTGRESLYLFMNQEVIFTAYPKVHETLICLVKEHLIDSVQKKNIMDDKRLAVLIIVAF